MNDEKVGENAKIEVSLADWTQLKEEADKAKEHWDRLLRVQADFENSRKRLQKESAERIRYANERLIKEVLIVADNLERAIESAKESQDIQKVREGIEVVQKSLKKILQDHGVVLIETKGQSFDPHRHEAIGEIESDSVPEGTVVEEIQKGYHIHDRVVRPSIVKVAKKKKK